MFFFCAFYITCRNFFQLFFGFKSGIDIPSHQQMVLFADELNRRPMPLK